jgi:hypothetical protein
MAKLGVQQIRQLARELIAQSPGGIRYGELLNRIVTAHPETPPNTVQGSIWNLAELFPQEITKPSRGLFRGLSDSAETLEPVSDSEPSGSRLREQDFYGPFANYLESNLDEVTVARSLGGAGLKKKWGTPDVVGVYKPLASDLIKFPLEIVSAEVKTDTAASVVAFGQSVSYRLFSAKSYIVVPRATPEDDLSRLEALCMLFGIGLVVFDVDVERPRFEARLRAQRFSPDMFYVNEFADGLRKLDGEAFEELFG